MNNTITSELNDAQMSAVTAPLGNCQVLAGAGSGKTRVLVHRIAWLIQECGLSPHQILAVTFTNKAARELHTRIEAMLGFPTRTMWVGTFHGLAHRFLRAHWQAADLPESFQILDAEDQHRLIKRLHKELNLDDDRWPPKQSQWFINSQKDEARRPDSIILDGDIFTDTMVMVYRAYEEQCARAGVIDFAELLLRSYEVLQKHPDILSHYQQRFQYILVDEFQDTNTLQYLWLRLLKGPDSHIMVVGDDDQSIYSWRGARIKNIQSFTNDFPDAQTICLEQNYRSTKTILSAANAVIANNQKRLGKDLWTQGDDGESILLYTAFNEIDEARYVISCIQAWTELGNPNRSVAILYRSNAQSRVLEEELLRKSIPYRIYGGQKFFDRAEIKDALAYLRLIANRHDDTAFERVVNTPTRGIGNTTLNSLRDQARTSNYSLWQAAQEIVRDKLLSARAVTALQNFLNLTDELDANTRNDKLGDQTDYIIQRSGLRDFIGKDRTEKSQSRLENLDELVQATHAFTVDEFQQQDMPPLHAFLAHVALENSENQADVFEDSVQLMTLHAAKGLEFDLVIICGVEEGLFPHHMSAEDPVRLEEERRLCYVGMTRAKQKLIMTFAECRRLYGRENYHAPSRFLREIPEHLVNEVRMQTKISRPVSVQPAYGATQQTDISIGDNQIRLGQRIRHSKFGEGTVLNYEGSGEHAQVQVKFDRHGSKWLMVNLAKLETI